MTLQVIFLALITSSVVMIRFVIMPQHERNQRAAIDLARGVALFDDYVEAEKMAKESGNKLFAENLQDRVKTFVRVLKDAKEGTFVVDKNEEEILRVATEMIATADRSIVATSYVVDWWKTESGKLYLKLNLKLNLELAKKGVAITRTFVLRSRSELDQWRSLLEIQVNGGIDLYVVFLDEVRYQHTNDLIVVDDEVAAKLFLTVDRQSVKVVVYTQKDDIELVSTVMTNLKAVAHKAETVLK